MKKLITTFLSLFLLLILTSTASGHGGPPFVLINGQPDGPNPVFSGSTFFKVATEVAPKNYLVGENLNIKIDTTTAPIDPNQLAQTTFTWEMGDGITQTGLEINHTYSKSGSYIVVLKVKDPVSAEPIEIESLRVNILPSENYEMPQAIVTVNGKKITDALKEPIIASANEKLTFEATDSKGKIKSYQWDFGDGTDLAMGNKVEHSFNFSAPFSYSFFPILRIEDENGLSAETIVQVTNKESLENPNANTENANDKQSNLWVIGLIAGGLILVVGSLILFLRTKSK